LVGVSEVQVEELDYMIWMVAVRLYLGFCQNLEGEEALLNIPVKKKSPG
jgi:hypothetical protein